MFSAVLGKNCTNFSVTPPDPDCGVPATARGPLPAPSWEPTRAQGEPPAAPRAEGPCRAGQGRAGQGGPERRHPGSRGPAPGAPNIARGGEAALLRSAPRRSLSARLREQPQRRRPSGKGRGLATALNRHRHWARPGRERGEAASRRGWAAAGGLRRAGGGAGTVRRCPPSARSPGVEGRAGG